MTEVASGTRVVVLGCCTGPGWLMYRTRMEPGFDGIGSHEAQLYYGGLRIEEFRRVAKY